MLHDLALRRFSGHRRTGTGILLALARRDEPKEELTRDLLVIEILEVVLATGVGCHGCRV